MGNILLFIVPLVGLLALPFALFLALVLSPYVMFTLLTAYSEATHIVRLDIREPRVMAGLLIAGLLEGKTQGAYRSWGSVEKRAHLAPAE